MNSYQCISGIHFVCCHGEIKWRPRTFTQVLATKAGDLRLSRLDQKKRGRYGHVILFECIFGVSDGSGVAQRRVARVATVPMH